MDAPTECQQQRVLYLCTWFLTEIQKKTDKYKKENSNQCWERNRQRTEKREQYLGERLRLEGNENDEGVKSEQQEGSWDLPWVWNQSSSLYTLQSSLPAWLWPHTTQEGLPRHPGEAGRGRQKQRHKLSCLYKFGRSSFNFGKTCIVLSGESFPYNYVALYSTVA